MSQRTSSATVAATTIFPPRSRLVVAESYLGLPSMSHRAKFYSFRVKKNNGALLFFG
jgi:hypothetical protein